MKKNKFNKIIQEELQLLIKEQAAPQTGPQAHAAASRYGLARGEAPQSWDTQSRFSDLGSQAWSHDQYRDVMHDRRKRALKAGGTYPHHPQATTAFESYTDPVYGPMTDPEAPIPGGQLTKNLQIGTELYKNRLPGTYAHYGPSSPGEESQLEYLGLPVRVGSGGQFAPGSEFLNPEILRNWGRGSRGRRGGEGTRIDPETGETTYYTRRRGLPGQVLDTATGEVSGQPRTRRRRPLEPGVMRPVVRGDRRYFNYTRTPQYSYIPGGRRPQTWYQDTQQSYPEIEHHTGPGGTDREFHAPWYRPGKRWMEVLTGQTDPWSGDVHSGYRNPYWFGSMPGDPTGDPVVQSFRNPVTGKWDRYSTSNITPTDRQRQALEIQRVLADARDQRGFPVTYRKETDHAGAEARQRRLERGRAYRGPGIYANRGDMRFGALPWAGPDISDPLLGGLGAAASDVRRALGYHQPDPRIFDQRRNDAVAQNLYGKNYDELDPEQQESDEFRRAVGTIYSEGNPDLDPSMDPYNIGATDFWNLAALSHAGIRGAGAAANRLGVGRWADDIYTRALQSKPAVRIDPYYGRQLPPLQLTGRVGRPTRPVTDQEILMHALGGPRQRLQLPPKPLKESKLNNIIQEELKILLKEIKK